MVSDPEGQTPSPGSCSSSRPLPGNGVAICIARRTAHSVAWLVVIDRLAELPLPRRDVLHGREVAAGNHQRLDVGAIDAGERGLRHACIHLADGIGVGGAEALGGDDGNAVLALVVVLGPRDHLLGVGRRHGDALCPERLQRPADGLRRGEGGHAGGFRHALHRDLVIVVGEQARRCLRQRDHFDARIAEQLGLVGHVGIQAGGERRAPAFAEPRCMHLQVLGQPAELDLAGGVGGRDKDPEMARHQAGSPGTCITRRWLRTPCCAASRGRPAACSVPAS